MAEDDYERIHCPKPGAPGHFMCGVCPDCNQPRFECGHAIFPAARLTNP